MSNVNVNISNVTADANHFGPDLTSCKWDTYANYRAFSSITCTKQNGYVQSIS